MPRAFIFVVALFITTGLSYNAPAQDAQTKTRELIAALAKTKYKKKEKKNFTFEMYLDIKSEAVVKNNIGDYVGLYESSEADHRLELRISSDGRIEGNGDETFYTEGDFDQRKKRSFTLREARIEGALLTAVRVYENGETAKLEAVFCNRTITQGKNPDKIQSSQTKYGLGFIDLKENYTNRVFLEYKP